MHTLRRAEYAVWQCCANVFCFQVLTHDGSTVRGKTDIMAKLSCIVELHMAFGMTYQVQHVDVQPWPEVCCLLRPNHLTHITSCTSAVMHTAACHGQERHLAQQACHAIFCPSSPAQIAAFINALPLTYRTCV